MSEMNQEPGADFVNHIGSEFVNPDIKNEFMSGDINEEFLTIDEIDELYIQNSEFSAAVREAFYEQSKIFTSVVDNILYGTTSASMKSLDKIHNMAKLLNTKPIMNDELDKKLAMLMPKKDFLDNYNDNLIKNKWFDPQQPMFVNIPKAIETVTIKPWTVKFIKTNPEAKLPHQASEGAACSDLYSVESVTIYPGKTKLIDTGLQVAHIPSGYRLDLFDRSGFRAKGIFGSSVGIIDEDYRGPLKVILFNSTNEPLQISVGDRIAQAALTKKISVTYEFTEVYEDTERGAGGFGSTGKN